MSTIHGNVFGRAPFPPAHSDRLGRGIPVAALLLLWVALALAMEDQETPDAERASRRSPEIPWTEAELDIDVAKRPRFVAALNRARVNHGVFEGPGVVKVPIIGLGDEIVALLRTRAEEILDASLLPTNWTDSDWYGLTSAKIRLDPLDRIRSDWAINGRQIHIAGGRHGAGLAVRVELERSNRLVLRDRPPPGPNYDPDNEKRDQKGFFFDTEALHEFLVGTLHIPFETPEDYFVRGSIREYDGVRVFVGNVFSNDRSKTNPHWYDKFRLLVTDTNPQYVGATVDFRVEAQKD